ncbi:Thiolase, N-terminal domain-containing protein [Lipomyces kononenkoae]|uniref:Thiolase, N-terminal domain-containing protein n=1 Tax=Lipomyces kononenkoae TaxID=34357 RepID=A0ACC3T404_LIPKO
MAERLSALASHIAPNAASAVSKITEKHPDDVVIVAAYRTALTKGGRGGFKDTAASDLLVGVLKGLLDRTKIDPKLIDDIGVGNVLAPGAGVTEYRAASLVAGIPHTTPVYAVNRQCSSGLIAVLQTANAITSGTIDIGIGAGVESMSSQYGPASVSQFSELLQGHEEAKKCQIPMGITSENVAQKYGLTRKEQDDFAAASYQKAEAAQKAGRFKSEIIPLKVKIIDPKTEEEKEIVVDQDDGIRYGVTAESLSKIKPAFSKTGSTHAGNASQVSDGAAAVLLTRRSVAQKLGLPIIGKFVDGTVVGVPPEIMGIGPAVAIPKILNRTGLSKDDVDIYEINEAFASQALYCVRAVGIDPKKVNPNGGAIAFGHPLGCTGARQIATLLAELKRSGKKIGVTSMCIGTGMGAASVIVAE